MGKLGGKLFPPGDSPPPIFLIEKLKASYEMCSVRTMNRVIFKVRL